MKKKQVKCYTYIRVSTLTQADNFSLDAQREKLHKYAEYQDMVIAGEYADEGFSGKNIQGRQGFRQMLDDIQSGKDVIDNPVYMGKIAYGRRRTEKKVGTRNEMHVVEQSEFPIYEGQHEAIISAMVNKPVFVNATKEKIGTAIDTEDMGNELETLRGQLRQVIGTKNRLEKQMDSLDISDKHYDRKVLDLQRRYDEQYDRIEEIEV